MPELRNSLRFEESLGDNEKILPYTDKSQYSSTITWQTGKPDGLVHDNDYKFKYNYDLIVADEDLSNIESVYSTHVNKLNKYPYPTKLVVMMKNSEFIEKYNEINNNPNIIIVKNTSFFEKMLMNQNINYDKLYELEDKIINNNAIRSEEEVIEQINKNLSNIYDKILNCDEQYINKNDLDQLLLEKNNEISENHKLITYN